MKAAPISYRPATPKPASKKTTPKTATPAVDFSHLLTGRHQQDVADQIIAAGRKRRGEI